MFERCIVEGSEIQCSFLTMQIGIRDMEAELRRLRITKETMYLR